MVTFMIFNFGKIPAKFCPAYKSFFPGTLIVIIVVTAFEQACGGLGIQTVKTGDPINSLDDITSMFSTNFPSIWSGAFIAKALPQAVTLTVLGYLDTLLTSLVVDQKVDEKFSKSNRWPKTNKNQELVAQGAANAAVAFFGGLPGAQATIRSVLILNEGAVTRIAGISVGILVIIEMGLFQSLVKMIPQAVLTGVLFKVGYDCFDWGPFLIYIKTQIMRQQHPGATDPKQASEPVVTHMAFVFIVATAVANSFIALHIVVLSACVIYYAFDKLIMHIPDLEPYNAGDAKEIDDVEAAP